MVVKFGKEFHAVGKDPVIIALSPEDDREFYHIPGDNSKCIIYDKSILTEQEASDILREIK